VSDKQCKLLDDGREPKIPFRGRLLDLFGVQVASFLFSVASFLTN
jgi:hypothetical protein